jgi:hypothetical protein
MRHFDEKDIINSIMEDSQEDIEVGSETGIEQKDSPLKADDLKSNFDWLASIGNIFKNVADMIRLIIKWR